MTAAHCAHENVGWSRKVVITFDLVSEDGDMGRFPAMVVASGVLSNLRDVDRACPLLYAASQAL